MQDVRWPLVSILLKQLSEILFRSSSKRSARVMFPDTVVEAVDGGPPGAPGGRLELFGDPLGESRSRPKAEFMTAGCRRPSIG